MCSIEEAAASTFEEYDKDGVSLLPVKELRHLIDRTYKKLDRVVQDQDVNLIKKHMNSPSERMINKDEFISMVKEAIVDQGTVGDQSDV